MLPCSLPVTSRRTFPPEPLHHLPLCRPVVGPTGTRRCQGHAAFGRRPWVGLTSLISACRRIVKSFDKFLERLSPESPRNATTLCRSTNICPCRSERTCRRWVGRRGLELRRWRDQRVSTSIKQRCCRKRGDAEGTAHAGTGEGADGARDRTARDHLFQNLPAPNPSH